MKQPPCIKDKCILYPVCKHKKYISCTELLLYWLRESDNNICTYFPNLIVVGSSRKYKHVFKE